MWLDEMNVECMWNSNCIIHYMVKSEYVDTNRNLVAYYGTPYLEENRSFWERLDRRITDLVNPWPFIGDLNEVVDGSEKH